MKDNLFVRYLRRQSFQPSWLSLFFNPFYFIRRPLFTNIRELAPGLKGKLIDLGCGRKPYKNLFRVSEYIGVDIETSGHDHRLSEVDVYYDGKKIPFEDNSFDSGFCSEVMEHVFNPDEIFSELHRVLKPGARLLLTVPFCWNEHEMPFDYARYTSVGLAHLLKKNGFSIVEMRKSGNFARVLWQMFILYIFDLFKKLNRPGYLLSLVFIVPLNVIGFVLLPLAPKDRSMFFNTVIVVEKMSL